MLLLHRCPPAVVQLLPHRCPPTVVQTSVFVLLTVRRRMHAVILASLRPLPLVTRVTRCNALLVLCALLHTTRRPEAVATLLLLVPLNTRSIGSRLTDKPRRLPVPRPQEPLQLVRVLVHAGLDVLQTPSSHPHSPSSPLHLWRHCVLVPPHHRIVTRPTVLRGLVQPLPHVLPVEPIM